MASFTEKIRILFDIDSTGANSSLKSLRTSVRDADGAFGKAKAGAGSLGTMLKENMGAAAIAGGAAIVAFGVKAVGAFTDTAKAAINLGDATGLSTEQASRWIGVGDDMQVSAEQLTSGLGKIAKTMDDSKWAEYGIATRDASGEAKDANDILLDTFDMLGKVENETERARIGNDLFGKGYSNLAPMIGKTRAEYEGMLGAVESGQVITEKEAAKAEKMRLAQDALSDALNEVTLAVGGMVAEMGPTIEAMAGAVEKALEWKEALGPLPDLIMAVTNPTIGLTKVQELATGVTEIQAESLDELKLKLDEAGFSAEDMIPVIEAWKAKNEDGTDSVDDLTESVEDVERPMRAFSDAANENRIALDEAAAATRDLDGAYKELTGQLDNREAWLNLLDSLDEYAWKVGAGTMSSREAEQATIDIRQELIAYLSTLEEVPAQKQTEILSLINQGQYDVVKAMLDELAAPRTVHYTPTGDSIARSGNRASGGPVGAGESYLIGEQGPEVVTFGADGVVTPHGRTNSAGGGSTTIINANITTGVDPRQVIEIIRRAQRTGQL
jgi:hypothetical protein